MLIVRLGAMGDILHSLPAVTALREAHPEWFLGWAVEPQWRELFSANEGAPGSPAMPLVDRLHIVPAKRWAKSPLSTATLGDICRIRRELRETQYDIAVDMQGAIRSAMIARWARTRRVIGEAQPREPIAKWLFHQRVATNGAHVIEQSIEVANAILDEHLPLAAPWLPRDTAADARAGQLPQPFLLISPGAGWGAKRWPAERYGAVAGTLAKAGYGVVINTGPIHITAGEEELAQRIVQHCGGAARPMSMSLSELIAVTRRASLAIAGDTGPLHLACALGRPVVGIFGPTDPARNGPFNCAFHVLRHPESVRDHTRRTEPEAGLLTITPEAVSEAALELLREAR